MIHRLLPALAVLLMAAPALAQTADDRPDPQITPGLVLTTDVDALCHHAPSQPTWSKVHRPPVAYTNRLKRQQLGSGRNPHDYEEDHLIPLSLGGNPTDPRNLWPEPWDGEWGAHKKDRLELRLYHLVCAHRLDLRKAQDDIARDWIAAWAKYCPDDKDCPSYRGRNHAP